MARPEKKKQSYGGCTIDHYSPARAEGRSTSSRRAAAVNLCIHIQADRITVTEGEVK